MILLLYLLALCVFYFLFRRLFLENFYLTRKGKFVFVTGCDSGFGRLLSLRLVSTGVNVFAGCYTKQGAEDLLRDASKVGGAELFTVQIDVTSDESVKAAREEVEGILKHKGAKLHGVVNNAGVFTTFGPDDWCSTEEYSSSLNVNTLGAIRVCHQFVPLLKQSKGRIVTMGSTAGRLHGLYVGPYVTAKFAVEAYMDCLRLEMRPFGVGVHILEPGAFKTDLLSEEAQHNRVNRIWNKLPDTVRSEYGEQFKDNFKIAWQQGVNIVANPNLQWVVSCYVHALFAVYPRFRYSPGWDAIFCFVPISVLPTAVQDWILSWMYSMQPGPPLVPSVLRNSKVTSLSDSLRSLLSRVGQLGMLSVGIVAFWIRSSFIIPANRAEVPHGNSTVTVE